MLNLIITTVAVFLPIDLVWLGIVAKDLYDKQLKDFERLVRYVPGLLVYILIPIGIALFVMPKVHSVKEAWLWGGLYGLIVYGTYDLTNYAVLAKWPLKIVVIDMLWGTFICGVTAFIVYLLKR